MKRRLIDPAVRVERIRDLRSRLATLAIVLLFALAPAACAPTDQKPQTEEPAVLSDIHKIDDLQNRFDQDAGLPRLVLLLSPT